MMRFRVPNRLDRPKLNLSSPEPKREDLPRPERQCCRPGLAPGQSLRPSVLQDPGTAGPHAPRVRQGAPETGLRRREAPELQHPAREIDSLECSPPPREL